jgi:hypothetical protein
MTPTRQQSKPTLVLGGTGKTGRRALERLEALGLPVRVGSRSGEPPFDWTAATPAWPTAFSAALGRAPRDFSAYVRDAAATGIWNSGPTRAA